MTANTESVENRRYLAVTAADLMQKVQISFAIALSVIFGLFTVSFVIFFSVTQIKEKLVDDHAVSLIRLRHLEGLIERGVALNRAYLLTQDPSFLADRLTDEKTYQELVSALHAASRLPQWSETMRAIESAQATYTETADAFFHQTAHAQLSDAFEKRLLPQRDRVKATLTEALLFMERQLAAARQASGRATLWGGILLSLSGLLGLGFGLFYYSLLTKAIKQRLKGEEALAQERQQLMRSNKELEQFASVAAHDLRSPLRSIATWAQMINSLLRRPRDERVTEALAFVEHNTAKAGRLIDDLLRMAHVESSSAHTSSLDLTRIARAVCTTLSSEIQATHANIRIEPLPVVDGNASQIESLFLNLIQNAITYRDPSRPPEITVGSRETPHCYELFVQDNGIGIAPEFTDKIFQMFNRLHSETEFPGTGIGLAICKKIVELRGGNIWVESTPGTGSTFHFTYPTRPHTAPHET